jgi:hypothetical protein
MSLIEVYELWIEWRTWLSELLDLATENLAVGQFDNLVLL